MQTTMTLLDRALEIEPAQHWHSRLKLNRNAFHNARIRQHLSPAIAGALAEELGEDSKKWIVIAALESERESACKTRMVRKLSGAFASVAVMGAVVGASLFVAPSPAMAETAESSLYIMLSLMAIAAQIKARYKLGW